MAINFEQDRGGLLSLDRGINYNQMAFKPGSVLDRQINKLNELEQMGYPQPNLQKLKDMDMKQFQEKGIPLSLPSDNYTAMNINNFNQMSDVNKKQFSITDLQPKSFNTLNNFYNQLTTPRVGNFGIADLFNTAKTAFNPTPFGIATLGIMGLKNLPKESFTDKIGLDSFGGDYDPYGYKSTLQHGNLGARQDPFGRNLVSFGSNYEKNRIAEIARLSGLKNLTQFQQNKLDFGKEYLEKLEEKRQAEIQEMQDRNRSQRTGGYQYGTQGGGGGAGKDFMEGSGKAKDMGSS